MRDQFEEHGYKMVEIDAPDIFYGMTSAEDVKYPVIVLRKSDNSERKSFTALYELGRLIMRLDPSMAMKEEESLCNLFCQ
ncbi:hypothetical protein [uncultured Fibrobacter sp.]|uniref:ImmA/IrrE family metallo-endopeptidase n=1 Tax=uncultured Fibrobacter sp. TaxID=261512 RepID=UPI0028038327|nr:hypothetical protein [uncultured Fibrobacter sp.]